jgi:hypothetical protein
MASYTESLVTFLRALRGEGLSIGVSEVRDALTVMETLGFDDRDTLQIGLRSLLAKNLEQQQAFSAQFDRHFVSLAEARRREIEAWNLEQLRRQQLQEAERDLRYDDRPIPIREDLKDVYIQMSEADKDKIRRYIDTFSENTKRMPALYRSYIHHMIEQQLLMEDAALGVQNDADDLLHRDISRFEERDIPRAIDLIAQLTRKLNRQLNRRRKQRSAHGTLDFKRTIGDGLRTGGALVHLRFRRRPPQRRRLVLLCDVSGSMLQFSEFALRFIYALQRSAADCTTFLFSEGLAVMSPHQMADVDRFRRHVKQSGLLGRGTDLSEALRVLMARRPPVLNSNTLLLIVSDGKSVDPPTAAAMLSRTRRLTGQILWLNPIAEGQWDLSPCITALRESCTMLCCSTLEQLADACGKAFL